MKKYAAPKRWLKYTTIDLLIKVNILFMTFEVYFFFKQVVVAISLKPIKATQSFLFSHLAEVEIVHKFTNHCGVSSFIQMPPSLRQKEVLVTKTY